MVKYPEMRKQVIEALQALADPAYQRRIWVERQYPHEGFYDDLTHNVNVLYDDTAVAEDPHTQIGVTLENASEAAAIEALAQVLDSVLADSGSARDAEIIALPQWQQVVHAARSALRQLDQS